MGRFAPCLSCRRSPGHSSFSRPRIARTSRHHREIKTVLFRRHSPVARQSRRLPRSGTAILHAESESHVKPPSTSSICEASGGRLSGLGRNEPREALRALAAARAFVELGTWSFFG